MLSYSFWDINSFGVCEGGGGGVEKFMRKIEK